MATLREDCQDVLSHTSCPCDGIYNLTIGDLPRCVQVYCKFEYGRGWTVIQKRLDGSVDFYRGWNDYVTGFGELNGEYWLGLDNIHELTQRNRKLSIYLVDHDQEARFANYSTFSIGSSSDYYRLQVSGYYGTAGDSLSGHNGYNFSTKDNDNDVCSCDCAVSYGAWWYSSCHSSNLNGIWYPGGTTTVYARGVVWYAWKEYYYSMKTVYMMIGR